MNNPSNKYYFNPPPQVPKSKEEAQAIQEARAENEAIWNRSGHRGLYSRLVKGGYFKSLREVMTHRFDIVVSIVSLENSL